jgi:predicted transcriptional regulator
MQMKEVALEDEYEIIKPDLPVPNAAGMFAENPHIALLIGHGSGKIVGALYIDDIHKAYADTTKKGKNVHKSTVKGIMNPNVLAVSQEAQVGELMAQVKLHKPHAIVLHNSQGRFSGYIGTKAFKQAMASM